MLKLLLSVASLALASAGALSSKENCDGLCKKSDLKFCPDGSYLYRYAQDLSCNSVQY